MPQASRSAMIMRVPVVALSLMLAAIPAAADTVRVPVAVFVPVPVGIYPGAMMWGAAGYGYGLGWIADPAAATMYPSCLRFGRCSPYDVVRFQDRPNRLLRLAPEAPPESGSGHGAFVQRWPPVVPTPEENIQGAYRGASQVREQYRSTGTPLDASAPGGAR